MTDSVFNSMPQAGISYTKPKTEIPVPQTAAPSATVKSVLPSSPVTKANAADVADLSTAKTAKKGPIKSVKGFISNIKKFFATASEYAKGTFKGIKNGVVAGSVVYTMGAIYNSVKSKAAAKAQVEFKNIHNKFLAGAAAAIALGASIWNASLNATQAKSDIDHRWTGHQ